MDSDTNVDIDIDDSAQMLELLEEIRDDLRDIRSSVYSEPDDMGLYPYVSQIEEIRVNSGRCVDGQIVVPALLGVIAGMLLILILKRGH